MRITLPRSLGLDRFSGLYLWAVLLVVFGIWSPDVFWTSGTVQSVASGQAIAGMVALAVLIPLACGQFDLSVGSNANLCGVLAVVCQTVRHWPLGISLLVALGTGLLIGIVNGAIVVVLRVNSFIATLGMGSILIALQTIITSSQQPQPPSSGAWANMTQHPVFGFQIVFLYLLILAFVVWWFLQHTPAGRYIYASGANQDSARLAGVRVDRWSWITLTASGLIAGLAGILYTSLTGPSLSFGSTLLLPAFSAAFLGSTQLKPDTFNVWGTLLAIYVIATGVEGIQIVSGQPWVSDMFNGVALIAAVALGVRRHHKVTRVSSAPTDSDILIGEAATHQAGLSPGSVD